MRYGINRWMLEWRLLYCGRRILPSTLSFSSTNRMFWGRVCLWWWFQCWMLEWKLLLTWGLFLSPTMQLTSTVTMCSWRNDMRHGNQCWMLNGRLLLTWGLCLSYSLSPRCPISMCWGRSELWLGDIWGGMLDGKQLHARRIWMPTSCLNLIKYNSHFLWKSPNKQKQKIIKF